MKPTSEGKPLSYHRVAKDSGRDAQVHIRQRVIPIVGIESGVLRIDRHYPKREGERGGGDTWRWPPQGHYVELGDQKRQSDEMQPQVDRKQG